jgi:hypothetical protein
VERVVKIVKERLPFWEKTSFFEIPLWNLGNPLYAENLYLRNLGNPLYAEPLFTEPGKSSLCGTSIYGTWEILFMRRTSIYGTWEILFMRNLETLLFTEHLWNSFYKTWEIREPRKKILFMGRNL